MTVQEAVGLESKLEARLQDLISVFHVTDSRKWRKLDAPALEGLVERACEELDHAERVELAALTGVDISESGLTEGLWYACTNAFYRRYLANNSSTHQLAA